MTPDDYTNREFMLPVGDGHQLYVQDWGNPKARLPILFLHGGPGAGVKDSHKAMFDPRQQRVIFFDQRGCGQSEPYGSLEHNTTDDLVADIDTILDKLGVEQVIITGASWGACLGLVYAIQRPRKVSSLVLRGLFTATKSEIDWLTQGATRQFFPDAWERYVATTPNRHAKDPTAYHFEKIIHGSAAEQQRSAYAYGNFVRAHLTLDDRLQAQALETYDPVHMRIEAYYTAHGCFIPEGYIFDNANKLQLSVWLIQGRYDMMCPPITAWQLHQRLPKSQLVFTVAGHGNDRANFDINRSLLLQLTQE